VVLSIFASYIFAMTVVPLYCATFIRLGGHGGGGHEGAHEEAHESPKGLFARIVHRFNEIFQKLLLFYEKQVTRALVRPGRTALFILGGIVLLIAGVFPFVGRAYFPRTDPGQFVIDLKMPTGTRLEVSDKYVASVE